MDWLRNRRTPEQIEWHQMPHRRAKWHPDCAPPPTSAHHPRAEDTLFHPKFHSQESVQPMVWSTNYPEMCCCGRQPVHTVEVGALSHNVQERFISSSHESLSYGVLFFSISRKKKIMLVRSTSRKKIGCDKRIFKQRRCVNKQAILDQFSQTLF